MSSIILMDGGRRLTEEALGNPFSCILLTPSKQANDASHVRENSRSLDGTVKKWDFRIIVILETGTEAVANLLKYVYKRKCDRIKQVVRIAKFNPAKREQFCRKLKFPVGIKPGSSQPRRAFANSKWYADEPTNVAQPNKKKSAKTKLFEFLRRHRVNIGPYWMVLNEQFFLENFQI